MSTSQIAGPCDSSSSRPLALLAEEEEQKLHSKILRQAFVLNYDEHAVQMTLVSDCEDEDEYSSDDEESSMPGLESISYCGDEQKFDRTVGGRRDFERRVLGIQRCPKTDNVQEIKVGGIFCDNFIASIIKGGCHGRFVWIGIEVQSRVDTFEKFLVNVKMDLGLLAGHLKVLDLHELKTCYCELNIPSSEISVFVSPKQDNFPLFRTKWKREPLFAGIPRIPMRLLQRLDCPNDYGEFPSCNRHFNVMKDSFSEFFPKLQSLRILSDQSNPATPQSEGRFLPMSLTSLSLHGNAAQFLSPDKIKAFANIETLALEDVNDSYLTDSLVDLTSLKHLVASLSNLNALPTSVKASWSRQVISLGIQYTDVGSLSNDFLEWKSVKSIKLSANLLLHGVSSELLDQWREQIISLEVTGWWMEDNAFERFFNAWNFKSLKFTNSTSLKSLRVPPSVEELDLKRVRVIFPNTPSRLRLLSLQECEIEGNPFHKVSFPHLKILDLAACAGSRILSFSADHFPMIDAPKLQRVSMSSVDPTMKQSMENVIGGLSKSHSLLPELRKVAIRGPCFVSPASDDHWALVKNMAAKNYLTRLGTHLSFYDHREMKKNDSICEKTGSKKNVGPVDEKKSTRTSLSWVTMLSRPLLPFSAEGTKTVEWMGESESDKCILSFSSFCSYRWCTCQQQFRDNNFKPVFELDDELSATYLLLRNDLSWLEMVNGCSDDNVNSEPEDKKR